MQLSGLRKLRTLDQLKLLKFKEKKILGLLNTRADISCISGKDWPKSWDMCIPPSSLIVLHQAHYVTQSSGVLQWSDGENSRTFHSHVIPVLLVIFGVETCYDRWECCCLLQTVLYSPKCYRWGLTLERALVNLSRAELCPLFQRLKMIDIVWDTKIYHGGHRSSNCWSRYLEDRCSYLGWTVALNHW